VARIDTALLRAEHPTNPLTVTGVLFFGAPLHYEALRDLVETQLLGIPRFRQRAVEVEAGSGRFCWQEVPAPDLSWHLQRVPLREPGDQAALQDLVSDLAGTQLDFGRPLWQFHLVERYGAGSALVVRVHHSIADGVTLVRMLLVLAGLLSGLEAAEAPPQGRAGPFARRHPGRRVVRRAGRLALRPRRTMVRVRARAADLLARSADVAATLANLLLYDAEPETPFKGALTGRKRAAWSAPVPLADVKLIGRRLGGTVNDVLVAALSGALRRYLDERGLSLDEAGLRAVVPVNTRPPGVGQLVGNDIGLVFVHLPIDESDPVASLAEVKRGMDETKGSLEPLVTRGLLDILGAAPPVFQDVLFSLLGSKATALITNVAGPGLPLQLAGAPLESILFWVPQSGGVALGISILSYAGQVRLGVLVDRDLVPDPEAIVAGFEAEMTALLAEAAARPEPPTLKGMMATLDGMLATLDALQAERSAAAGPPRCQALTRAGQPCKNQALPGSDYCRVHQPAPDAPGTGPAGQE
jgi:WS/DGAT/MGAT family acyltransferase